MTGDEVNPQERDALLAQLGEVHKNVMKLDEIPVHFAMGALYALGEAVRIVNAVDRDNPTCLIACRHTVKEE